MTELKIDYRDCDRVIWDEELADFVPDRVLDAHIHCYWHSNHSDPDTGGGRPEDTLETLNSWAEVLYPCLLYTSPSPRD